MRYAAYGSNLHPLRMQQRTSTAHLLGTAILPDVTLRFHKRGYTDFSGKCNIVPHSNDSVHIAIYDISETEMRLLDQHEGAGSGYNRAMIHINGFGDCITYIAASTHIDESLLPFSWYRELVIVGCEELGFPQSYVEQVKAVAVKRDLDCDRRTANVQLIEQCKVWHLSK